MERMASRWAEEFDPGSLVILAQAAEKFDVRGALERMRAPLLYVLSSSDAAFPASLVNDLGPQFDAADIDWRYVELASAKGHLASGADSELWADALREFMQAADANWTR